MYCSNCGEKILDGASFCSKCGNQVGKKEASTTVNMVVKPEGSGAATASMVLGILAIIAGVITFMIAAGMSTYTGFVNDNLYGVYDSEVTFMAIAIVFLPAVLSIIGFCLALASRGKIKNGSNTAGLVLNIITIILCVAEYLMITG